jgi:hypothetical protein
MVEGKRKRPHLFRIVLSHSQGYSEAVWQQTTESFIRCLENSFRSFSGTLITDDLRAGIRLEYALIIHTRFHMWASDASGY